VHAFDVLGDPVRRRILELLTDGELASGAVSAAIQREFGISQPAVSQHLKVLRDHGFATVRPDGTRRLYAVNPDPLRDVDAWLGRFRRFWTPHLGALATELARGRRERRLSDSHPEPHRGEPHDRGHRADQRRPAAGGHADAGGG
jgi:DNA-binding transcriptional ArsR family regulator